MLKRLLNKLNILLDKWRIFWFCFWHLRSSLRERAWKSWNGLGITTNWPEKSWEREVREISQLFKCYLPEDWIVYGPYWHIHNNKVIMFCWPKNDPQANHALLDQHMLKGTLEEMISEIREIKWIVGGEAVSTIDY